MFINCKQQVMRNLSQEEKQKLNEFAIELVMPEYKFIEIFYNLNGNLCKIADKFGVSVRAAEIRAFTLGLIGDI